MRAMGNLEVRPMEDAAWDSFVAASPHGHLLQTSRWGALKARFGREVDRVALVDGCAIVAGAQVFSYSAPLGLTLAYVPKGPLVDWDDERVVRTLLAALREAAHRRRAFCLKLEPDLLDDPTLAESLVHYGLRPSPQTVQPRSSILIDLDPEEDEILMRMKPKTRYNIRLAQRKGVTVREGNEEDIPLFYRLLEETRERGGFAVYEEEYYLQAWRNFAPQEAVKLLLAYYCEEPLAGLMVFGFGSKAWYLYGASSKSHRNHMPNYLLQWRAVCWAKERGCSIYDLWGIPEEAGRGADGMEAVLERGGLWGLYRFKRGFGGRVVRYLGAYDDVYSRPVYWLYNQAYAFLQRKWGETWHRRLRSG